METRHYSDVIMSAVASQITSLTIVYSTVYSGVDQRKHQSSASLALWGEFTGDRWIPSTEDQKRGKYYHLMTSSWNLFTSGCEAGNVLSLLLSAYQWHQFISNVRSTRFSALLNMNLAGWLFVKETSAYTESTGLHNFDTSLVNTHTHIYIYIIYIRVDPD